MQLALVTCDDERAAKEDKDREFHLAAFGRIGVTPAFPAWSDPSIDWPAFDRIVIRSTWDYTERFDEFMHWLDAVGRLPSLHNPAAVIRWNIDKRYLGELADAGVPVVPTTYLTAVEGWSNPSGGGEVVVKPTVSAGSRLTGRFAHDDPAAHDLAEQIWGAGKVAMVQPFIEAVASEGETAVVAFGGEPSHAFTKGPLLELGGGFLGGEYTEVVTSVRITDDLRAITSAVQAAHAHLTPEPLLYARYDYVRVADGSFALLEAELFEPSLFFGTDPSSADRFAAAVLARHNV